MTISTGETATIFLSLAERQTHTAPYYLFVFRSRSRSGDLAVILAPTTNDSRLEQFDIDVDTVFEDMATGQYTYTVHEQESSSNIDPEQSGKILETGLLTLAGEPAVIHEPTAATTFYQP